MEIALHCNPTPLSLQSPLQSAQQSLGSLRCLVGGKVCLDSVAPPSWSRNLLEILEAVPLRLRGTHECYSYQISRSSAVCEGRIAICLQQNRWQYGREIIRTWRKETRRLAQMLDSSCSKLCSLLLVRHKLAERRMRILVRSNNCARAAVAIHQSHVISCLLVLSTRQQKECCQVSSHRNSRGSMNQ